MPVTSTGMTNGGVEPSDEIKPDSRAWTLANREATARCMAQHDYFMKRV
jgi:hypothetical protein